MKKIFIALGIALFASGAVLAQPDKPAPLETEMAGQVYLCGLNAQLADITKGPKQKGLLEEARACAEKSREKVKSLVKQEYAKYPDGDSIRLKIKALYAAYLTYLDSAMWGRDLTESKEALAFKDRVSEYKVELELR
ncbi:hypothetical protein [Pseudomonas synxantha]|uniref:hypothetical protein n=1 Tax=Pseudomonas synxantha TaxID=47883 RepID=UPI0006146B48|nr:hypothetical protein [Pseudomonas synxantha]